VGPTVDVEDQGIFLARRKIGWTLHPSLDTAAVEALVPDRLWLGEVDLGEEIAVDVGEAIETARCTIEEE